jgi:DNA polymerase-3 subunit gamma/tau
MRDSLSLLDQILSACGEAPTDAQVADALGTIDRTVVHAFAKALVRRDAKDLLARTEEMWTRGTDLKRLAEELAWELRHVFVAKCTGAAPEDLADNEREAVLALAREADTTTLTRLFDVVHGAIWEVARAAQPRLAFEVTLLKGIELAPGASLPELAARLERLAGGPGAESPKQTGAPGGRPGTPNFRQ